MKTLTLFFALFITSQQLHAQENFTSKPTKFKVYDASLNLGSMSIRSQYTSVADFQKLAPNSSILASDLKGFNYFSGNGMDRMPSFNAAVGFKLFNAKKQAYSAPVFRIGVNYFRAYTTDGFLSSISKNRVDTLTSNSSNTILFVDSINENRIYIDHDAEQLRLDASLYFYSNQQTRWSVYGGFGVNLGLSFNSYISISKNQDATQSISNGTNTLDVRNIRYEGGEYESESFQLKNSFGAAAYIPLGVNFKIAKRNEFWKRANLYYELRPGINYINVQRLRSNLVPSLQSGLGFRYSIK